MGVGRDWVSLSLEAGWVIVSLVGAWAVLCLLPPGWVGNGRRVDGVALATREVEEELRMRCCLCR